MRRRHGVGYWFIAPATLHLVLFALVPIVYALYLSLFKWDILKDDKPFVAFANYLTTFQDKFFWNAMWNSTRYTLVSVPVGMAVALLVALLVHQKIRGVTLFRTLYYIPAISSGVAVAMLWTYVYLPEQGLINATLKLFGHPGDLNFLNESAWAMWALVFMSVWTGLGPRMVLFLAGLVAIPNSLYEAADLDGSTRWRTFWKITLPMLVPTTFFVLVTSTISAFQIFTPVYMMTKGEPDRTTDVVGYHIYSEAWEKFHVGLASAKSFVLLVAILGVAYFQYRAMRDQLREYDAS
ncbi:MAG: sugar ABC transporter permease [Fimbriimonadaceae bacterium]|nr:sugar ABC transporter permease [Fimbriimonadaceae bacterium]